MKDKLIASLLALTLLIGTSLTAIPPVSTRAWSEIEFETAVAEVSDVSVVSSADPKIIYVDDDNVAGPWNGTIAYPYQNITSGLEHADANDEIFVRPGTYREHLDINKNNLTLIGYGKNTIIDGMGTGTVVKVRKDSNVTMTNFTIQNSGPENGDSGICVYSSNNTIKNNIILNTSRGISLSDSHRNVFADNIIRDNKYAIYLVDSSYNKFEGNIVRNNNISGIYSRDSNENSFYHNSFIDNAKQTDVLRSKNTWNDSYPSGGNYWSNYAGVDEKWGPKQDQPGSDGIGDTNYTINADNVDHYPRLEFVRNVDTGLAYCWIQKAIDADETVEGHTIKVNASICFENVIVYKSLILLPEENRITTIIDGLGKGTVLDISASNVFISNFTIQNGTYGVHLDGCGGAVLRNNNMTNNKYNFFVSGAKLSHFINDVDASNLVDGKRIYYLINNQSLVIDNSTYPELGYLGLVNCTNIIVQNLNLTGNGQGLLLAFTNSSTIINVNASNNGYGIYLFGCSGDTITGNNIMNNDGDGVNLFSSSENTITGNNITNNVYGIWLYGSGNNVTDNNIAKNGNGVSLLSSSDSNIAGNDILNNDDNGVYLSNSYENIIASNKITKNDVGIFLEDSLGNSVIDNNIAENRLWGIYLGDNTKVAGNNITNNLVGIYLVGSGNNVTNNTIMSNQKGISLGGSGNNVTDNNVANNRQNGIELMLADATNIVGNNITNNNWGIYLIGSSNNNITENNITNSLVGICLVDSNDSRIYHNNFIGNTNQTSVFRSTNTWDDGYPSGGNYWSGYVVADEKWGPLQYYPGSPGSDGIWDAPYKIDADKDGYPLTKPYGGQHDIGIPIIDLSKSCSDLTIKINLTITITVINYGIHNETVNITVQARNATHSIPIGSSTFNLKGRHPSIGPPSKTITFTWNTTGQKNGTLTIEANLTPVPGETCFKDNTNQISYAVSVEGDVNGDGKVDGKDVALVIKAFARYPGHTDWDTNVLVRNADVNDDGIVNGKDVAIVIKYFGKSV